MRNADNPEAPAKAPIGGAHKPQAPANDTGPLLRQNWWTQRGSKRWLNDEASLEAVIRYVLEGQEGPRC
jgi:hypothetical protein